MADDEDVFLRKIYLQIEQRLPQPFKQHLITLTIPTFTTSRMNEKKLVFFSLAPLGVQLQIFFPLSIPFTITHLPPFLPDHHPAADSIIYNTSCFLGSTQGAGYDTGNIQILYILRQSLSLFSALGSQGGVAGTFQSVLTAVLCLSMPGKINSHSI